MNKLAEDNNSDPIRNEFDRKRKTFDRNIMKGRKKANSKLSKTY